MYTHIYIYICTRIVKYTLVHIHIHMHTPYIYVYVYRYAYVFIYIDVYIGIFMYIHRSLRASVKHSAIEHHSNSLSSSAAVDLSVYHIKARGTAVETGETICSQTANSSRSTFKHHEDSCCRSTGPTVSLLGDCHC